MGIDRASRPANKVTSSARDANVLCGVWAWVCVGVSVLCSCLGVLVNLVCGCWLPCVNLVAPLVGSEVMAGLVWNYTGVVSVCFRPINSVGCVHLFGALLILVTLHLSLIDHGTIRRVSRGTTSVFS